MEWQPIETAPKDGTWILGFKQRKHIQDQIETWRWVERTQFVGWEHAANTNTFYDQPTHWMPLPAPQQALRMLAPKRSASEIIGSQNLSRLVAEGYTVTSADLLNETSKALEYAKGAIELALSTSDEPMTREQVLRLGGVLRQSRVTLAKLESEV